MKDSVTTVFRFEHLKMLKPYLEQIQSDFNKDTIGVETSITYCKGKGVHVSFYAAIDNGTWFDGRQMYFDIDTTMTRFNQKRFDEIVEKWKLLLPHMATLYVLCRQFDGLNNMGREWSAVMNVICTLMPDVKAAQNAAVGQIKYIIEEKLQLADDDCVGEIVDVKPNKQEMNPSIQPGVTYAATPEMEAKLAERINKAIINDGECVHNCTREDDSWAVPVRCKVRELHPDVNPTECDFVGWPKFKNGVMITFDVPQNVVLAPGKLRELGFSDEFRNYFFPKHQDLQGADCAAIRIETEDGKFLEYVVSKSA